MTEDIRIEKLVDDRVPDLVCNENTVRAYRDKIAARIHAADAVMESARLTGAFRRRVRFESSVTFDGGERAEEPETPEESAGLPDKPDETEIFDRYFAKKEEAETTGAFRGYFTGKPCRESALRKAYAAVLPADGKKSRPVQTAPIMPYELGITAENTGLATGVVLKDDLVWELPQNGEKTENTGSENAGNADGAEVTVRQDDFPQPDIFENKTEDDGENGAASYGRNPASESVTPTLEPSKTEDNDLPENGGLLSEDDGLLSGSGNPLSGSGEEEPETSESGAKQAPDDEDAPIYREFPAVQKRKPAPGTRLGGETGESYRKRFVAKIPEHGPEDGLELLRKAGEKDLPGKREEAQNVRAAAGAGEPEINRESVRTAPSPAPVKKKRGKYVLPPLSLVAREEGLIAEEENADLYQLENEHNAEVLKSTLRNFGIGVKITAITRGPTVTRFEFKPEEGVKISRIVSLTDDIALNLAAQSVRMEAPIPGKSAIGIEIPNRKAATVYIHDVLASQEYREAKSKLSVALGKDIDGKTVISDLAKMPHLLIAGSTGSGKSVCINTMIMGILFNATPEEVKFIMVDPKVVELGIYNNIPHLLIPVVTEPKKASAALAWAVGEVERRYREFADHNVRDLASYNRGVTERPEMAGLEKMPQIVIIIDELADLMMAAPQDVEKSIIRLAQKARAAGVHLVIATQRPSVDVITGIIKANIPSRVAFAVASQFDSRTILDTNGAEKLLGRGDMLYHPLGFTKSARIQCAFVSDDEVERVVQFVKDQNGGPEFDETISESINQAAAQSQKEGKGDKAGDNGEREDDGQDFQLICEAAELAFQQGGISTSSLQRRMRLGYSRAARIIDSLEEMGLLTQSDGSKPRTLLMTQAEWNEVINSEK